jgi:hypothetical protein
VLTLVYLVLGAYHLEIEALVRGIDTVADDGG